MTTIAATPCSSATDAAIAALGDPDGAAIAADTSSAAPNNPAVPCDGTAGTAAASPYARYDLHPDVRAFVRQPAGEAAEGRTGPVQDPWAGHPGDAAVPLYQRQQAPAGQTPPIVQAPPRLPPAEMATMARLSTTIRAFTPGNSPFPGAELIDVQRGIKRATDALQSGDYTTAAAEFEKLGFPLPQSAEELPSRTASLVAHMLGLPTTRANGTISVQMNYGPHGNQALNDLNGFAANARMMSRFAGVPATTNPPSETQAMNLMKAVPAVLGYLKHFDSAAEIMQLASEITEGMIVHYSAAGRTDPLYGVNPSPRFVDRDPDGTTHEFASLAEAARAGHPRATAMASRSPDAWGDIASVGRHEGRLVGDCESKLYLQTRLLTAAGFTSLGSADVQPPAGTGHMLGVFKAPDGSVWVTSNENFSRVRGTGPGGAVTHIDLDGALRDVAADVYHVAPDARGQRDTSRFTFAAAATRNLPGPNAATDTLRRATELTRLGRSEVLVESPPQQPAAPRRNP